MKKIMFNDRYGLTDAVLRGAKTQTRRISEKAAYSVGEIVAVAQSYSDVTLFYQEALRYKHSVHGQIPTELDCVSENDIANWFCRIIKLVRNTAGWNNKMFVKADLMPHHIRINIWRERLQDISDEDCIKEGIIEECKGVQYSYPSNVGYCGQYPFGTPKEAYSALIDKISGKGTWASNPYVWVYEFEKID